MIKAVQEGKTSCNYQISESKFASYDQNIEIDDLNSSDQMKKDDDSKSEQGIVSMIENLRRNSMI